MLRAVVKQFDVNYVLLDKNHVPALAPLYAGEVDPEFLCMPEEAAPGMLLFKVAPCD